MYGGMRAPGGDGTIALHQAGPDVSISSDGVRLYFEVRDVDDFCRKLQQKGFYITRLPRMTPWGWRHAYVNDPDGHEISLYWAGENRMKKTVMNAARAAEAHVQNESTTNAMIAEAVSLDSPTLAVPKSEKSCDRIDVQDADISRYQR